jgi:nitrogen regulatory protein PII
MNPNFVRGWHLALAETWNKPVCGHRQIRPKAGRVEITVDDDCVDRMIEAIFEKARTRQTGDGKVLSRELGRTCQDSHE